MTALIVLVGLLGFGALGVWYFLVSSPAQIASTLRMFGPSAIGLLGLLLTITGRVGLGAPLIVFAFAMFARARRAASVRAAPGQRSTVRSAMLEMILDHDTGEMDGMVLGGTFEGRQLQSMSEEELMQLAQEVRDDGESVQLLEAYLDRRMPGWRDDADTDGGPRERPAANSGAMTEQEAYQILGLEPGASLAEIRKAHRSLMQRVHPDLGGSSFLAQRINEAKDFLLRLHNERS
ncbi:MULTISPECIES: DnaJ domain-containing protein [unclassified Roseitalea]|uniref:DnaJ domain-containing protein n=1 Tax=unclassified Roseitalea TaxID=2639107 RepID=UPI00273F690C|nr:MULTISPECIES: DnaJ domain-containing protein [unclassified Roseitalea]